MNRLKSAARRLRTTAPTAPTAAEVEPDSADETEPTEPGIDPRYAASWTRLARGVLDTDEVGDPGNPGDFDPDLAKTAAQQARRQQAQAVFAESLASGERLEIAVSRAVSALAKHRQWDAAWALAEGAGNLEGGRRAGIIGHAVVLHRRRHFDQAWEVLSELSDEELATFVPYEAVDGALTIGTAETIARARSIAGATGSLTTDAVAGLAGRFLAMRDLDTARSLMAEARSRDLTGLDERLTRSLDLVDHWLDPAPHPVPDGAVPVAVIDYQTPDQDLASGNLGDYIQTLSLLGNLARLSDVTFSGEDGLAELATELQDRVRPELRLPGTTGQMHLFPISREFSEFDDVPDGTWMIAFGWHMHPMYDLRYDFPYHRSIRPLFLSFHVNRLDMLSDEALDYLRKHGPVGCRDWTTVNLLLSAGVDAFFTGCLTTTVDAVFPQREDVYEGDGTVAVVDLPRRSAGRSTAAVEVYTHQADKYRHMSFTEGVHAARDLLGHYQRTVDRAVTRRLHAYLPMTALGIPVRFRPGSPGDVRFPGLSGFRPGGRRLRRVQNGIRELVAETMTLIVEGADEDQVYARWRALTADRVAEAKERFAAPAEPETTEFDVAAAAQASWQDSRRFGPHDAVDPTVVTDVVLCFDQNLMSQAAVMLESMVANATGPLRLWVMSRGLDPAYPDRLSAAFPDLPMTFLPCDHIDYGDIRRVPDRITISTMDRLLLPVLLTEVSRVVYVDIDTIVLGDICELGRLDLQGKAVAARDSDLTAASEWRNATQKLPEDEALELQRRAGRHGLRDLAINGGVLILDLDRLRVDDFTSTYLAWVERYGLHDQDIVLAYVGTERVHLDPRWNALPVLEIVRDPKLIHWAGLSKPWEAQHTFAADRWRDYANQLHHRVGTDPGKP